MPKNDSKAAQNTINYQGDKANNVLDNIRGNLLPQNQQLQNRYNTAADESNIDYSQLAGLFKNFAETGGLTPEQIADIRARAIAPTRAVYQNAQTNINRQRALGGYSPNYTAATAKLTRGMSDAASDASVNANASIAELIQRGKLAGAQGGASLYGMTPGRANMYGNQLDSSNQQYNQLGQLQSNLGLGIIDSQIRKSQIPGNYQQALGNIGSTLGVIGKAATLGIPGNIGSNNMAAGTQDQYKTLPGYR